MVDTEYEGVNRELSEVLQHHGVKGQKWGVRKDRGHDGEKARAAKINRLDKKFEKKFTKTRNIISVYNAAADKCNRNELLIINNKAKYRGADFTVDSPLRRKYYAEHQKAMETRLQEQLSALGSNASGTREYTVRTNADGSWYFEPSDIELKHSESELKNFDDLYATPIIAYETDLTGKIVKFIVTTANEIIEHHGVKGMRWGYRKRPISGNPEKSTGVKGGRSSKVTKPGSYTKTDRKRTAKQRRQLTDSELLEYTKRLESEKRFSELIANDASPAKKFINSVLRDAGKQALTTITKNAMLGAVRLAVDDEFSTGDLVNSLVITKKR